MEATTTMPRTMKKIAILFVFLIAALAFTWQNLPAQEWPDLDLEVCGGDCCCSTNSEQTSDVIWEILAGQDTRPFRQCYKDGLEHLQANEAEEAAACFIQALINRPDHVKAMINLGRAYLGMGWHEDAEAVVDEALELDANNAEAHLVRGRVMDAYGDNESAIAEYERCLELNEDNPHALNNLALIYILQGKYADAAPLLKKAIAQKNDVPYFFNNLGVAYEGTGGFELAELAFQGALAVDSGYANASANLVRIQNLLADSIVPAEPENMQTIPPIDTAVDDLTDALAVRARE